MSNDTAVFQSGEVDADRLGIYVDSVGDLLASKRLIVVRTEKTDDSPACQGSSRAFASSKRSMLMGICVADVRM